MWLYMSLRVSQINLICAGVLTMFSIIVSQASSYFNFLTTSSDPGFQALQLHLRPQSKSDQYNSCIRVSSRLVIQLTSLVVQLIDKNQEHANVLGYTAPQQFIVKQTMGFYLLSVRHNPSFSQDRSTQYPRRRLSHAHYHLINVVFIATKRNLHFQTQS